MDQTTYGLARRALPLRRQAQIVLLIGLATAAILALSWGASRLHAAQPGTEPGIGAAADNELRLTSVQL